MASRCPSKRSPAARRVGMGTLYRHFPAKEDLVDAVLEDTFDEIVDAAQQALTDEDAWRGLCGFLDRFFGCM
jgi:AcrR family transcriptional regulator